MHLPVWQSNFAAIHTVMEVHVLSVTRLLGRIYSFPELYRSVTLRGLVDDHSFRPVMACNSLCSRIQSVMDR